MSIRAVYILSASTDADVPLFTRKFPTVEARCKSQQGKLYVGIPNEVDFVKILFTEIGLRESDTFNKERDQCNKEFSNPVFQVNTSNGVLWPVVVTEHKNINYCAVILDEKRIVNHHINMKLVAMGSVTSILEALNGLAHFVGKYNALQEPMGKIKLLQYISSAFPYGRPVCCDPSVAMSFSSASWKGKVKQPAWNPLPYKGKSNVTLHIREEIRSIQYNKGEIPDQLDVYGAVSCTSELEGIAPDISLVLSNSSENKCCLLVNSCVSNIETVAPFSTRLRFHPVKDQNVCLYKMTGMQQPPIRGTFSMKPVGDDVNVFVHLHLLPGVKNGFQKFEVHIANFYGINSVKSKCSQGSLSVNSDNTLIWNVGSKLPSKTLEAYLKAKVKLKLKKSDTTNSPINLESKLGKDTVSSYNIDTEHKYATIFFTIVDYIYSGNKIDPQSILISNTSKVNRIVIGECYAGTYNIWNSQKCGNIDSYLLEEDFTAVLEES